MFCRGWRATAGPGSKSRRRHFCARKAQEQAEKAQEQAENAQEQAERAQEQAGNAQEQAERAQEQAERIQEQAENAQEQAETARDAVCRCLGEFKVFDDVFKSSDNSFCVVCLRAGTHSGRFLVQNSHNSGVNKSILPLS